MAMRNGARAAIAAALLAAALVPAACAPDAPAAKGASGPATRCILLPLEHGVDAGRGWGSVSHLLLLNPAAEAARVRVRLFFTDRDPAAFELAAAARTTTESASSSWPVGAGGRFALVAESDRPVVCQATVGWNSTANDYRPGATARSPRGVRETARSTLPAPIGRRLFLADGIDLGGAGSWLRETETLAVLVREEQPVRATLRLHAAAASRDRALELPSRRLTLLLMAGALPRDLHYGAELVASRPLAAAWLREVYWQQGDEPMASWSVPLTPLASR